jgi:hypothetical protein
MSHPATSFTPALVPGASTLTRSVLVAAVVILLLIYPLLQVAHLIAAFQVAGKNVYTVAPTALMALLFIMFWPGIRRTSLGTRTAEVLILLAFMWLLVSVARSGLYSETEDLLKRRYVLTIFAYALVFHHLTLDQKTRELMSAALIIAATMQACIGIVHAHLFSFIQLIPDENDELTLSFDADPLREAGTMLSASAFAAILVCGQFVLLGEKRLPLAAKFVLMILLTYAVTLSGSRYPIAVSALLVLYFLATQGAMRAVSVLLSCGAIFALVMLWFGGLPFQAKAILRFDEDSGGRFGKLSTTIELLTDHWWHLLIGVPSRLEVMARTIDGLDISDNSYGLLAMQFGLPILIVWVICLFAVVIRKPTSLSGLLILAYFLVNLSLTNSILWEPWLVYFSLALWVVRHRGTESRLTPARTL